MESESRTRSETHPNPRGSRRTALTTIGVLALLTLTANAALVRRQQRAVNSTSLSDSPRQVTVVEALESDYRDRRSYVGAARPWIEASVGPQFVSAYVTTVAVRPGAEVAAGDVLATLDCASPAATTHAVEMQAAAIATRQRALATETARNETLLDGGYVAQNDVEQKAAVSDAMRAELLATRARLRAASLNVRDCVLRAPFAGEVATREVDPGAFVQPGTTVVSIVDRSTVRVTLDVPEKDFEIVAPGRAARLRMLATGDWLAASITRRAPKAEDHTRTVHCEIDVADPRRTLPVGTTALVEVDVGDAVPATVIPIHAARVTGDTATLMIVEANVARERNATVLGEREGRLFLSERQVPARTLVVVEGRAQLADGDPVRATPETPPPRGGDAGARGAGYGGPM